MNKRADIKENEPQSETDSLFRRAADSLRGGEVLAAREMLLDILDMDAQHALALNLLAVIAQREDELDEAVSYARRAVEADPARPQFWRTLALSQRSANDLDGAIESFEKALGVDPRFEPAFKGLVNTVGIGIKNGAFKNIRETGVKASPAAKKTPVSIIMCSVDRDKEKKARAMFESLLDGFKSDIVVIRDPDSLCAGYTRGANSAKGEILIFAHDDIDIMADDFAAKILTHLEHVDLLGTAGTTKACGAAWVRAGWPFLAGQVAHRLGGDEGYTVTVYGVPSVRVQGIQSIDGLLMAAKRKVVETIGFDAETFDGFHLYDVDFSFRAHLAGFQLGVANDLHILHESGGSFDDVWKRYAVKFLRKHKNELAPRPEKSLGFANSALDDYDQIRPFMRKMLALAGD